MLITLFLYIEARRYRYYVLWSVRTRLLETDFFDAMLVPLKRNWSRSVFLQDLKRGVTALSGTGMYTGRSHPFLMCAVPVTEINHLKVMAAEEDSNAFVIVSLTQEYWDAASNRSWRPIEHAG